MSEASFCKPCPFCGSTSIAVYPRTCEKRSPYNPADRAFPVARCRVCWAEAAGEDWKGRETAIVKWNRRTESDLLQMLHECAEYIAALNGEQDDYCQRARALIARATGASS